MRIGSLFTGIGGLERGLVAGIGASASIAWQAEINPFCRRVLRERFPGVRLLGSVQEVQRGKVEAIDLVCGGFPC